MINTRKPIGKNLRFAVLNRDNFTCQYCGAKAPNVILEIDHKTPVSDGGSNEIDNLITSCFDCNRGKNISKIKQSLPTIRGTCDIELVVETMLLSLSLNPSRKESFKKILLNSYTSFKFVGLGDFVDAIIGNSPTEALTRMVLLLFREIENTNMDADEDLEQDQSG